MPIDPRVFISVNIGRYKSQTVVRPVAGVDEVVEVALAVWAFLLDDPLVEVAAGAFVVDGSTGVLATVAVAFDFIDDGVGIFGSFRAAISWNIASMSSSVM